MDLSAIMKKYADQIGGQFTQYDQSQSIIIIPVSGGRFQTVLGTIKKNELYNRELLTLNSKVCAPNSNIDYKMLLEQTAFFNYCRFVINQRNASRSCQSGRSIRNETNGIGCSLELIPKFPLPLHVMQAVLSLLLCAEEESPGNKECRTS
jgi:hypothetical protein